MKGFKLSIIAAIIWGLQSIFNSVYSVVYQKIITMTNVSALQISIIGTTLSIAGCIVSVAILVLSVLALVKSVHIMKAEVEDRQKILSSVGTAVSLFLVISCSLGLLNTVIYYLGIVIMTPIFN